MHRSLWNYPITFCVCWDNKEGLTHDEESPDKELQHSAKKPQKKVPARNWLLREKNPPSDITTYTYKSSVIKKNV